MNRTAGAGGTGGGCWLPTNQRRDFTFVTPFLTVPDQEKPTDHRNAQGITVTARLGDDTVRAQVCSCYEGTGRSVTVRTKDYAFKKYKLLKPPNPIVYRLDLSGY